MNRNYLSMLSEKDVIFEIFQYSLQRAAEIGAENVYDFSLGNPSVPAPPQVNETMRRHLTEMDPLALHGYSPSFGLPDTRAAIAASLNEKYGSRYEADNIFMTIGAAGALAHALRAAAAPGDTVLVFAPYFSEYKPYIQGAGLAMRTVPAEIDSFQINFEALHRLLTPEVSAVLINSPNNPSGVVYSTKTIVRLAEILKKKAADFGHPIYLISDEPYRDILFEGTDSPYIANFYEDTLTCYSFSKSLSLPGERIGYLAIHPDCTDGALLYQICPQISRTIGQNGPASLMQHTVRDVCGDTSDLAVYEENKKILMEALTEYGYRIVEPGGSFYMFPRSPEPDSYAFCERAKKKDLLVVPGDVFGCPGHFRIAYCVPTERVRRSLPVFRALIEEWQK